MLMRKAVVMVCAVGSALVVGACGGANQENAGQPATTAAPASTSSSAAAAQDSTEQARPVVHRFTIEGGELAEGPDRIEVAKGETVVIEVTSDVADELHVHGYDKQLVLAAGKPAKLEFVANIPGAFEIELHEFHGQLTQLRVTG